ncbi:MAG: hypothetical protein ACK40Y_04645 [Cloacibacterium caeni]
MKKLTFIFLVIFNCFSFAQKDKNIIPLKLNLPKNELEPKKIRFEKNEILIDDKKCFNYELFHDVEVNGEQIKNYYEIKSLNGDLLFSGNISNFNPENKFTDTITFYLLENKIYKNSEIVGRGKLVLNLSANQVLNNDCSINLENLKLFYEQSNENK